MFRSDFSLQKVDQKALLSSPTMYETSMRYVMEAYETNCMSTVGENVDEVDCKYGAAGDMAFDATVNPIVYEGGIPVLLIRNTIIYTRRRRRKHLILPGNEGCCHCSSLWHAG